jgi:hypothetical protein
MFIPFAEQPPLIPPRHPPNKSTVRTPSWRGHSHLLVKHHIIWRYLKVLLARLAKPFIAKRYEFSCFIHIDILRRFWEFVDFS